MYNELHLSEALDILNKDFYRNITNIDNINYLLKQKAESKCFLVDDCIVFSEKHYGKDNVFVCPTAEKISIKNLLSVIKKNYDSKSICFDVQLLSENKINQIKNTFGKFIPYKRIIKDYYYSGIPSFKSNSFIRPISINDKDLIEKSIFPSAENRPPLSMLFNIFVEKNKGFIIGFIDNNILKGYLSFENIFQDIYDVDYIFVQEPYRKNGIGKMLTEQYLLNVFRKKGLPVWSNAINAISESIAQSCGFKVSKKSLLFL